jgi:hypothetical protein
LTNGVLVYFGQTNQSDHTDGHSVREREKGHVACNSTDFIFFSEYAIQKAHWPTLLSAFKDVHFVWPLRFVAATNAA